MYKEAKRKRIHLKEKTSSIDRSKIQKAFKKEEKSKEGLNCCTINSLLHNIPNFIGCFSSDEIQNILIDSLPLKLIVNLDNSSKNGSHWLAIRVDKRSVEIFDPLGFKLDKWPTIPFPLIDFIRNITYRRKLLISRELQPRNSYFCGFYCIFYFLSREISSFHAIVKYFSTDLSKNDRILKNLLYKIK